VLQVLQHQKTGKLFVADLPSPQLQPGGVLVKNVASVISAGTERTSVQTAQASLIGKARMRPDLVRQVLDNVKREGALATYRKVKARLDNYKELGYSSAGIVVDSSVSEFQPGDRVACAGVAYHAEEIFVPKNLVVHVPDSVPFDTAAFTTLATIALQGVRQADVRLGETVVVIGVGLIGLLTIQLLKASGCRVIGLDVTNANFSLAQGFGCDALFTLSRGTASSVHRLTKGRGADAIIVTASSTSNEPLSLAMELSRKRGRVVIVGAVGMDIPRSPFYEKEVDVRISCSYGPGRYDPFYEIEGHDYPIGYVRWTENRNMEAVVELMAQGKVTCHSLISHRFPITDALRAYDVITGKASERYVAVLIEYPGNHEKERTPRIVASESRKVAAKAAVPHIGFIGAGNFAQSYLLPHFIKSGVILTGVATQTPAHARKAMETFGFAFCTTDASTVLDDAATNAVVVATHHDSHARYVVEALQRGKHVFVEKPLAISHDQLDAIVNALSHQQRQTVLFTGFNRRFSRPWQDIKDWFADRVAPMTVVYRVNAGSLPANHWLRSDNQGGRVIGEACHFVDCLRFVTGSRPIRVFADAQRTRHTTGSVEESVIMTISFEDGSLGTIAYVVDGEASMEKEYCEISSGGRTAVMKGFAEVLFGHNRKVKRKRYDGTKGHKEEVEHFVGLLKNEAHPLLTIEEQIEVTLTTLLAVDSIKYQRPIDVRNV
jgi:predicted dehydrogenase/threonine dehydrogenase-like Zn-dependent dehydrogenase